MHNFDSSTPQLNPVFSTVKSIALPTGSSPLLSSSYTVFVLNSSFMSIFLSKVTLVSLVVVALVIVVVVIVLGHCDPAAWKIIHDSRNVDSCLARRALALCVVDSQRVGRSCVRIHCVRTIYTNRSNR